MAAKPRSLRVEGIVLRHREWGEADRMLTIITRELGKVSAVAKGVRKPRSRKAGHLEPFMRTSLQLARGRSFFVLTQAEAIAPFIALREDLVLVGYASYIAELLDRFTFDEEENRALYRLISNSLTRLNRGDNPEIVVRYHEIRLLDHIGFRPQLFNCANCEEEIQPEDQFFSAAQGGVFCPNCGGTVSDAKPISMQALKYLRHFQRSSYREAFRAQVDPQVMTELERLMNYYLTYLLESGLNTPAFLRRVRKKE
ncbi:MAG: DNA repair protein RecO [Anaerolineales bacterium]|nr:DNA repair protein RecO [Chloroflexota bacterium]MBL6981021.1 DNA repair protein RecO [Anaerolineales bacterium]